MKISFILCVVFVVNILFARHAAAHEDFTYTLSIKEVQKTKGGLIIKGSIMLPKRKIKGVLLPTFQVCGIPGKPLVFPNVSFVKNPDKQGVYDFKFDLMSLVKNELPKKKYLKINSFFEKPYEYPRLESGSQMPFAEIEYRDGGSIFVYFSLPLPKTSRK